MKPLETSNADKSASKSNGSSSITPPLYYEGKCDICTKPDGERGHNLQKCRDCGVLVHELCYGMVPTSAKNEEFVCHACLAVRRSATRSGNDDDDNNGNGEAEEEEEGATAKAPLGVEVNCPSRLGGWLLKDVLATEGGINSFRQFLRGAKRNKKPSSVDDSSSSSDNGNANNHAKNNNANNFLSDSEKKLEFCISANEFQTNRNQRDGESLKIWAQHIFDTYCANNAPRRVDLPQSVLSQIESKLFDNGGDAAANENEEDASESPETKSTSTSASKTTKIHTSLFEAAQTLLHKSLETSNLQPYKQSPHYSTHLASRRTLLLQTDRPAECALCSVKTGIHALHPLYDFDGPHGRQLVLPASGVGIFKRRKRLAWVHSLCAMFICSSERTGSLVWGCDEDGNWEENEDEEDDEEDEDEGGKNGGKDRVIESSDEDEDEEKKKKGPNSEEEEQANFTNCERVFLPLMTRLNEINHDSPDANSTAAATTTLKCLESMIQNVDLLTPPFIREYQIGQIVKKARKSFDETTYPKVKAKCKRLSAEMKRVYNEKVATVPEGFQPIKNLKEVSDENNTANNHHPKAKKEEDEQPPKYKVGTSLTKEFDDGTYTGKITDYDPTSHLYHVVYTDGDSEDLTETEVSRLLLSITAFFCMEAAGTHRETRAARLLKAHREFVCVICKKKDNVSSAKCLRIPVQCSAGDRYEFHEFRRHHKTLNRQKRLARKKQHRGSYREDHKGCAEPVHVGCARWGGSDYAKVKNRTLRMCYYFPGMPPTYTGEDPYMDPVSNCFCRRHAIEVQEGIMAMQAKALLDSKNGNGGNDGGGDGVEKKEDDDDGGRGTTTSARNGKAASSTANDDNNHGKRKRGRSSNDDDVADDSMDDVSSERDSEDSAERERRTRRRIARKKRKGRILEEESDEE
mmetsp:Transcript_24953/g.42750  ORF Transcript_24953/g.42750 Transcript_24953/m.42750 type:complete len:915 (-) Transcript_24953:190-2934(-)|eukprot:CAMPEP_0183712636 /NCGR_PEP_ID=MMETSP0737-20130205/7714_1 /TAXON_ID=385413 /ORGANISM="Thalassiosira miniscula, Strain CCMP1093" /LENGTH=914 /DNA_ID=CAMNT_0025941291 /DNA_START=566 /DNA_END=3310 /DNA_ORIENTATION=+